MRNNTNLSDMIISGWESRYSEIVKEFGYNKKDDLEAAILLDTIIKNPISLDVIKKTIQNKTVFCIGAGYSLKRSIEFLKKHKKIIKIAADSSLNYLLENNVVPDIVVTDLDGDHRILKKFGKTKTIFIVHAHADNISKLHFAENFKNCLGTTQTKPVGKIKNFGGFTDGDRTVFLANYFSAKKIILFGMDFGKRISILSNTKRHERTIKIKKLQKAKMLLEWLAKKSRSELYTTSSVLDGFEKIPSSKVDIIIT